MVQHDHAGDSAVPESPASNIVTIPCYCPKTPHLEDTVTLAPEVSVALGEAALTVSRLGTEVHVATGDLMSVYLQHGVIAWTLVDEKGLPERVTRESILRRLTFAKGGYEVAEAADDLYSAVVMRPLLAARERSSQNGQQEPSTPPTKPTGTKRPEPSEPSSPSDTAGSPSEVPAP